MPQPTRDQMLDFCRRWQAAMAGPQLDELAELYAPDSRVESPMTGSAVGPSGATKGIATFADAFPDRTMTFEEPIIDGSRLAIVATNDAKHVGTFLGLAPTGRRIHVQVAFVLDVEDGRIVRERRIYDFTGLLIQVGVIKAKPQ
jgi:predicted ester cyclase